jgi:hypothetical protein
MIITAEIARSKMRKVPINGLNLNQLKEINSLILHAACKGQAYLIYNKELPEATAYALEGLGYKVERMLLDECSQICWTLTA